MSDYRDRILTALIETGAERANTPLPSAAASRPRRGVAVVAIGCAVAAVAGLLVMRGRDGGIDVVSKAAGAISPRTAGSRRMGAPAISLRSPRTTSTQTPTCQ